MTEMTMVERVARAACESLYGDTHTGAWNYAEQRRLGRDCVADEEFRERFRRMARAMITAMREPTNLMGGHALRARIFREHPVHAQAMSEVEYRVVDPDGDRFAGNPSRWEKPMWRAMIDAALAETPAAS